MASMTKLKGGSLVATIIGAALAILILVNVLSGHVFVRLDLTHQNLNTLSGASRDAVQALSEVEVTLYLSPDLPETIRDEMGQQRVMRDVSLKFRDKIEEYRSYAGGNMTVHEVTGDIVDKAKAAKLRAFSGEEATAKEGRLQFKEYVLGATFHYKDAMEVFPLALYPEHYEFEMTRILLRLKEKVANSVLMKDVLSAGKKLHTAVEACDARISKAEPEEDAAAANPFGLMTAEASKARVDAYGAFSEEIATTCKRVVEAAGALAALEGKNDALDTLALLADAFDRTMQGFTQSLAASDDKQRAVVLQAAQQLHAIANEVTAEHDNLVDSPGRKSIGFVCAGRAFCPFPDTKPLIPPELQGVIGQKNPFSKQIVAQLGQMTDRMNMIRSNVERNLFRRKGFDITRVDLAEPVPATVASLVLFGPQSKLTDLELFRIDQYVLDGGSLVVFVNGWDVSLMNLSSKGDMRVNRLKQNGSNIGDLLAHWGIRPRGDLMAEPTQNDTVTVLALIRQGGMTWQTQRRFPYPILPVFSEMDTSSPLVRAVASITLPYAGSLELTQADGRETTALITSSKDVVAVTEASFPVEPSAQMAEVNGSAASGPMVVAAVTLGSLTSYFAGKDAPTAPTAKPEADDAEDSPKDQEATRLDKGEGRVLVIGSNLGLEDLSPGSIFPDFDLGALTNGSFEVVEQFKGWAANLQNWEVRLGQIQHTLPDNIQFLFNVLDWSIQKEALVEIRSKQYQRRPLEQLEEDEQGLVKLAAIAGAPLLFILFGLLRYLARRSRKRRLVAVTREGSAS